jgi:cell division protein FtsZ
VSVVATGLRPEVMAEESEHQEETAPVQSQMQAERKPLPIPQPSPQAQVRVKRMAPSAGHPMVEQLAEETRATTKAMEMHQSHQHDEFAQAARPIGRIPSIDQFPRIAQEQVAAQQSRIESIAEHASKKRKGLFERLADVGLGRRSEHHAPAVAQAATQPAPRRAEPRVQAQPAPATHEAPAPRQEASFDDQLAIPAFLRRQAAS